MGILKIMHSFWESKKSKPKKQTNKKAPFRNFVTQGTKKKRILLYGLNVSHQNPYVQILNPNVMVYLGHEVEPL